MAASARHQPQGRPASARIGLLAAAVWLAGCGSVEQPPASSSGSSGDLGPDARSGVDYSWARPAPDGLRAAGYTFAVRYLSYDTTGKNLTADEATQLIAAGVDVVANWENAAMDPLAGNARGASDAAEAVRQAVAAGMPDGRPIYFSVDFDATADQLAAVSDYFDGVASVLAVSRIGSYGGFPVVQRLFDTGKISFGWQTTAWSSGRWEPRAQLRQIRNNVTIAGGACDIDQAAADDFGQWP